MIEQIEFENFRILKKATLELSPLTLLIGPNGSGKSTVLQALNALKRPAYEDVASFRSIGSSPQVALPSVNIHMRFGKDAMIWQKHWTPQPGRVPQDARVEQFVSRIRVFNLDHIAIAASSPV
ncbi:MAG: AAA family ATPase [Tepidisphaeraceae bacterium]|jgi:ABC-type cobalamin/Fe3+-siderophores transport system ATPase subunit